MVERTLRDTGFEGDAVNAGRMYSAAIKQTGGDVSNVVLSSERFNGAYMRARASRGQVYRPVYNALSALRLQRLS